MQSRLRVLWGTAALGALLAAGPAASAGGQPCSVTKPSINPNNTTSLEEGATIQLNASGAGNDVNTWVWTQTAGPAAVDASGTNTAHLKFNAPEVGAGGAVLKFTVTAKGCTPEQTKTSDEAIVNVTNVNVNTPPTAVAEVSPTTVGEGEPFTLDGSNSTDAENPQNLSYKWEQVDNLSYPVGLPSDAATVPLNAPTGVPYPAGLSIRFRLTVTDPEGLQSTSEPVLTVKWVNDPPIARASVWVSNNKYECVTGTTTATVDERTSFTLDAQDSTDDVNEIASYAWIQTVGGPSLLIPTVDFGAAAAFDAPSLTRGNGDTMKFKVTVTDNGTPGISNSGLSSDSPECTIVVHDVTPPVITVPGALTAEATSKDGAKVTYDASARDDYDGSVAVSCSPESGSQFALGSTTVKCDASDAAGNPATKSFTVSVVDTTPPTIDAHDNVSVLATSAAGAYVTYASPSTHDIVDGDGTATCTPASGGLFSPGSTQVTCDATDKAGNKASPSATFTVNVTFTFVGFFQPIDNVPAINTVKNGSTVPVKWQLKGQDGIPITDVSTVVSGWPRYAPISCSATGSEDAIETTVTGGTSLRYDPTGMQFVYNWKTSGVAGQCYRLDVKFTDGTTKSAWFKLK